jgi:hypothetical protein
VREFVTTLLDAAGLSLVAAGVSGGLWPMVGAWALCVGGVVVLAGSWLAARGDGS